MMVTFVPFLRSSTPQMYILDIWDQVFLFDENEYERKRHTQIFDV